MLGTWYGPWMSVGSCCCGDMGLSLFCSKVYSLFVAEFFSTDKCTYHSANLGSSKEKHVGIATQI